jgi:hypothetical protein
VFHKTGLRRSTTIASILCLLFYFHHHLKRNRRDTDYNIAERDYYPEHHGTNPTTREPYGNATLDDVRAFLRTFFYAFRTEFAEINAEKLVCDAA